MSEEYRKLFLVEFKDLVTKLEKMIIKLEAGNRSALKEIYRILHTIKGSAGVMGYHLITDHSHQTEEIIKSVQEEKREITEKELGNLYYALNFFKKAVQSIERKEPIPTGKIVALRIEVEESPFTAARAAVILNECQNLGMVIRSSPELDEISSGWMGTRLEVEIQTDLAESELISRITPIPEVISVSPYEPGISIPEVRIEVDKLDRLIALVSELALNITRLESLLGFSSRPEISDATDAVSSNLTRLRDELIGIRLIPLSTLFRQFPNWFRNEAITLAKNAELVIQGGELEVDRTIFEYLREPIIHILRNALVHGIETEDERKKRGKGPGLVKLKAIKEGDDLIVTVSDNGRGIDLRKVLKTAIKIGLVDKGQASKLSAEQILMFIIDPRFTTLNSATRLGGRGVGLEIVKKKMEEIGGNFKFTSKLGQGSTFILTIPLSLAIVRSMVAVTGGTRFAIPFSILKDTMKYNENDIHSLFGQRYLLKEKKIISIIDLPEYLNLKKNGRVMDIMIAQIDKRTFGFLIEKIEKPYDLMVRPLPKKLGPYIGASIHPDGLPILHLDLKAIVEDISG